MNLAEAKSKIRNYDCEDHTHYALGEDGAIAINDDAMEAILKLLKDIESRVTALER